MTTATPPTEFHLVVGYGGSPPASRALDGAARLLHGRIGRIDVVYVAHLSSLARRTIRRAGRGCWSAWMKASACS